MPTMVLAVVAIFSVLVGRNNNNDVAAGLAAMGMVITAIMWARI